MLHSLGAADFQASLGRAAAAGARELAELYRKFEREFDAPGGLAGKIGNLDGITVKTALANIG